MSKCRSSKKPLSDKDCDKKALADTLAEFEELREYEDNLASYEVWIRSQKKRNAQTPASKSIK